MHKSRKLQDISIFYHHLAWFLLLVPQQEMKICRKFAAIAVIAILWLLLATSFFYTIKVHSEWGTFIVTIATDLLKSTLCTISTTVTIARAAFAESNFLKFFRLLEKFRESQTRRLPRKLVVINVVYVVYLISCNCIDIASVGLVTIPWYSFIYFHQFLNYVIIVLLWSMLREIKENFRMVNEMLTTTRSVENPGKVVERCRRIYTELTHLVEHFNEAFGWQIFLLIIVISGVLLQGVNFIILVIMVAEVATVYYRYGLFVFTSLWFLQWVVMGGVVAVICGMTTKEARKTAMVCYDLLLNVPAETNDKKEKIFRKELFLLSQQATHQHPYITAAGFFTVDYKMLVGLLGTMTSYVIVLIQINK